MQGRRLGTLPPNVLKELRNRLGLGECTNANSFRLVGESYQISFQGKPISLPNSVGQWYLREFLSQPNRTFDPIDLEQEMEKITQYYLLGSRA